MRSFDICSRDGCGHPRYGHAEIGQRLVLACPMCWAVASTKDGYLMWTSQLAFRRGDHVFEEPA